MLGGRGSVEVLERLLQRKNGQPLVVDKKGVEKRRSGGRRRIRTDPSIERSEPQLEAGRESSSSRVSRKKKEVERACKMLAQLFWVKRKEESDRTGAKNTLRRLRGERANKVELGNPEDKRVRGKRHGAS